MAALTAMERLESKFQLHRDYIATGRAPHPLVHDTHAAAEFFRHAAAGDGLLDRQGQILRR